MTDQRIDLRQCPRFRCEGREVIRRNASTGQQFVGCSLYPKCKQSRPLDAADFGEQADPEDMP